VPRVYDDVLYQVTGRISGDFDLGGRGFLVQGHDANLTTLDSFENVTGGAWMEISGNQ
jgi:hypothetical protein